MRGELFVQIILIYLLPSITDGHTGDALVLTCDGRHQQQSELDSLYSEVIIEGPQDMTDVLNAKWYEFMNNAELDYINQITVRHCAVEHLADLTFKEFHCLEVLYLQHLALRSFDFSMLEGNTYLRELHLNNNPNLATLDGNASIPLEILNLNDTGLERFPGKVIQFKGILQKLDISGCELNATAVCEEFEMLTLLNGKECKDIRSHSSLLSVQYELILMISIFALMS